MADSQSTQAKLIANVEELREKKTAGTKAHDLRIREFKNLDDPDNLDADSKNSLFEFNYDKAQVDAEFAPQKAQYEQRVAALKSQSELLFQELEAKIAAIAIPDPTAIGRAASREEKERLYLEVKTACQQKIALLSEYTNKKNATFAQIQSIWKAAAAAYGSVAGRHMSSRGSAAFYPSYCSDKYLLQSNPERRELCDSLSARLEEVLKIRDQAAALYAADGLKSENPREVLEARTVQNEAKAARYRDLAPIVHLVAEIESQREVAQTSIFLGCDNPRLARRCQKAHRSLAEERLAAQNEEVQGEKAQIEHELRILDIEKHYKENQQEAAKKLAAAEPLKAAWAEADLPKLHENLAAEVKKALADIDSEVDKLDEALRQELAAEREACEKSLSALKNCDSRKEEELFISDLRDLQGQGEGIKDVKAAKALLRSLKPRLKAVGAEKKAAVKSVRLNAKERLSLYADLVKSSRSREASALVKRRGLSEAKIAESVKSANVQAVRELYQNYSAASVQLANLQVASSMLERDLERREELARFSREVGEEKVRAKYDSKLDLIYKKMDSDRLGISYGRVLNHEKLINKRYAHLAKLQNRTKLVQKSYTEALDAVKKSYELEIAENRATYEKALAQLERRIALAENTLIGGPSYAKTVDEIKAAERHTAALLAKRKQDSEYLLSVAKESLETTTKAWKLKAEFAVKSFETKRQNRINNEYLKNAGAIRTRRFSKKYTGKRIFIRIFVIVAICTTLGLINLIIPNPLLGFVIGVVLAVAVEVAVYFFSTICYIMPRRGSLLVYNSNGELLFKLTPADIVNESVTVKRSYFVKFAPALTSFQIMIESGADIFRLAVRDRDYRAILLEETRKYLEQTRAGKAAALAAEKEKDAEHKKEVSQQEVTYIAE